MVFWIGCFGGRERVKTDMKQWTRVRLALREGELSKRELMRREGLSWEMLQKIEANPEPPGYRMKLPRNKPKLGPYLDLISQIIEEDKSVPKKQRHTATRIYHRIKALGYRGKYTQVREAVSQIKAVSGEVYMPLIHRPGEAQVDFGYALAKVSGVLKKVAFFVMALPFSDAFFVTAFEKECTETYWEGHARAFEFFGGVPSRISYDNTKVLVSKIIGPHERDLTDGFLQLQSHYLFREHFCRVRRPNEKGVVEGVVKYARQNFLVPVPQVKDLDELNAMLQKSCRNDLNRRLRGKGGSKWDLLQEDQAAFLELPVSRFDACIKHPTRANSLSLVRFDNNDYSVPVSCAYHEILVKGYVDRVVLCHHETVVARHSRSWEKEGRVFRLPSLSPLAGAQARSPGSCPPPGRPGSARVFRDLCGVGWWPGRRSRADGTRKYIKVLRLLGRSLYGQAQTGGGEGSCLPEPAGPEAIAWLSGDQDHPVHQNPPSFWTGVSN